MLLRYATPWQAAHIGDSTLHIPITVNVVLDEEHTAGA